MANLPNRIALVYDWVVKWGGAERVLLALHELFPQAPLYTSVHNPTAIWAKVFPQVFPSFLQKFPLAASHHELYPWLTPLAFESLDLSSFDLVISVTSADAKGIITSPNSLHICYCLTPTRYLWSHELEYKKNITKLFSPLFIYLKLWDQIAANRPDAYIAISKTVQSRIKKYYHQDSEVVYPPVDMYKMPIKTSEYYLWVGRLVPYKSPIRVIEVFNKLGYPLVVAGEGSELNSLKRLAKSNVKILGFVTETKLQELYSKATALIMFHEEDFGLVSVEAQSVGIPVIGLNNGGVAETVIDGVTGILDTDLVTALARFEKITFNSKTIIAHAQKFSKERFQKDFVKVIAKLWTQHQSTRTF